MAEYTVYYNQGTWEAYCLGKLLGHFGSPEAAWEAVSHELYEEVRRMRSAMAANRPGDRYVEEVIMKPEGTD